MARRNKYYDVRPRYTPGSPAMVGSRIALQVAQEEEQFIQHALEGVWGDEQKLRAEVLGLSGIVMNRKEVRGGWEVIDVITGDVSFHPSGLYPHLDELNELRIRLRKIRDGAELPEVLDYWRGQIALNLDRFLKHIEKNQYGVACEVMRFKLPTKDLFSSQLIEFVEKMATKRERRSK